ncbi:peptide transporter PTR2A [Mycena vulgaris]|nr:peptide transporter PTR2A [Mycena vulgaris]
MAGLQIGATAPLAAISGVAAVQKGDSFDEKHSKEEERSVTDNEPDGIHDGLVFPTDEERATLRRVPDTAPRARLHPDIPWNAYLIAIVELAERLSFYRSSVVFTNFIQQPLPPGSHTGADFAKGVSGALGMGQRASTGLTTFYQFWCYVTPLLGVYIADTYWGRYNTTCVAVVIALVGHIILIVAGGVIGHKGAVGAFIVALLVMGFGTGLFKANISPLVAEQYRRTKLFVRTTSSGEKVIVDPALTISRVYMYFYLFINIGALVGQIGMTYSERYVGFWLAYTLPTVVFLLCPIILFLGRRGRAPHWVDEVRRGLGLTYGQLNNDPTSQAATMVTGKVPNDVLSNLDPFALIIFIPVCDLLIYPALRRAGIQFTQLKRITAGFHYYIYKVHPSLALSIPPCPNPPFPRPTHAAKTRPPTCLDDNGVQIPAPLNVWIQTGAYVLIAFSEILASITSLEYAFIKAPKNMRSLVMSIFLFMNALSSALAEAFVSLSADPLLVWNYGVMAVLTAFTAVLEDELNNLAEGHVEAKH